VSEGCDVSDSRLSRTLLLRDCKVDGAEISHSILGEGCVVSKGARITDSVLADFTVVGPGETITGDRIVRCLRSDYNSVLEKKRG
jgi:ADP-glucose pyrophosphorylase